MFHWKRQFGARGRCVALVLLLVCCLMPLPSLAAEFGTVKGGTLRLRAEPSNIAVVLGAYPTGTWVEVTERGASWHRVIVDGKSGYMSAHYIDFGGVSATTDAQVSGAAGYINLREEPSSSARVLATYVNGTRVKILSSVSGYYRVQVGAQNGYMVTHLVRPDSATVQTMAIIRTSNGGNLNLRDNPSMSAGVIRSYRSGTQVEVLQRTTDWCRVRISGVTGYMRTQHLSFGGTSTTPPTSGVIGIVNNPKATQVLNLRETASLDARVLAYYRNGARVEILEQGATWHRVRVDGRIGYMMARYLQVTTGGVAPPSGSFSAVLKHPNGGSVVNFRAQPGLNSTIYGAYPVGTAVTVLAWDANWCMVRLGEQTGYVSTYFLRY